jgi:hypothetical protein
MNRRHLAPLLRLYTWTIASPELSTQDHVDHVARMEWAEMSLLAEIDWVHIKNVAALHWVRVLVEFISRLQPLQKELSAMYVPC